MIYIKSQKAGKKQDANSYFLVKMREFCQCLSANLSNLFHSSNAINRKFSLKPVA
jgi:hypothetical protein